MVAVLENGGWFYKSGFIFFHSGQNKVKSPFNLIVKWIVYKFPMTAHRCCQQTEFRFYRHWFCFCPGAIGPAVGVILASYAGCDKLFVTILFTIGMGLMGFCYASLRVNSLDLSPNYAGSIMALQNGLSSVSGMVAPYLIGVLTPNVSCTFISTLM